MNDIPSSARQAVTALTLKANFSWTFLGNVVYAGCQWGMLVILAKLGSPEMVGQFALGLAIVSPVMLFAGLNTRMVQATDARNEYAFADYLGLRLITTALGLLVIVGITLRAGYQPETTAVILAVGVAKAFESISDTFHGLFMQHECMDRIARSKIAKGVLSLMALGAGTVATGATFWGVVGMAASWALVLCLYDFGNGAQILRAEARTRAGAHPVSPRVTFARWEMNTLVKLAWLALPLGIVAVLGSLITNIPRYQIQAYLGEYALGIFAAMAYLKEASNTVVLALGYAASPRLARYYTHGDVTRYRGLLVRLVAVGTVLGGSVVAVAAVAGRPLLTLIYQPEYARYAGVFVWLMVAAAIDHVATFLHYGMTAARYFKIQVPLFACFAGIAALTGFWLVPADGLRGAALAVVIATTIRAASSLAVIVHAVRTRPRLPQAAKAGE